MNQQLSNTIRFAYGQLRLQIIAHYHLSWWVVATVVKTLKEWWVVRQFMGFFVVYWEILKGFFVWVVFGVPPHEYWWGKDRLDVLGGD